MTAIRLVQLATAFGLVATTAVADVMPPVPESYETAGDLAGLCAMSPNSQQAQFCLGYIVGIADSMPATSLEGRGRCGPRGFVSAQLVDVVRDWLAQHDALRDRPAAAVVADALADRFTCRR